MNNLHEYQISVLAALIYDNKGEYIKPRDLDGIEWSADIAKIVPGCIKYHESGHEYDVALLYPVCGEITRLISEKITLSMSSLKYNAQAYLRELKKQQAENNIIRKIEAGTGIDKKDIERFTELFREKSVDDTIHTFKDAVPKYLEMLDLKMLPNYERYETGIRKIDEMLGALVPGMLITIGGLTGLSKTNVALNIYNHNVVKKVSSIYFSSEMTFDQLYDRLFAMNSDMGEIVPAFGLRNGILTRPQRAKATEIGAKFYDNTSGVIIETSRFNINKIKKHIAKHKCKIIVLDFIQMFLLESGDFVDSRASAMSEMATRIKELAMETKTIIIALSQVNATGEMKESRGIEEKSDIVMRMELISDDIDIKTFWLNITKNRYGATGKVEMKLDRKTTRITENI